MRIVLGRYLSAVLIKRFGLLAAGILFLATIMDFLNRGEDIIAGANGNMWDVFYYTVYNLPTVFSYLYSFAALVAALFTFIGLMRHSELIAMLASGVSQSQLMTALLPAGMVIVIGHIFLDNYVLRESDFALRDLGIMEYSKEELADESQIWTREGNDIIRIRHIDMETDAIEDVMIFRRDDEGHLVERLSAPEASLVDSSLKLRKVTRTVPNEEALTLLDEFEYPLNIDMNTLATLMLYPRYISWFDIRELLERPTLGNKPHFLYRIWMHKKIAAPLGTLTLIMLAVPLVQVFDRKANQFVVLLIGLGIGFLYVILDSIIVALGEASLLTPFWAAWTPTLLLIVFISTFMFQRETIKSGSRDKSSSLRKRTT